MFLAINASATIVEFGLLFVMHATPSLWNKKWLSSINVCCYHGGKQCKDYLLLDFERNKFHYIPLIEKQSLSGYLEDEIYDNDETLTPPKLLQVTQLNLNTIIDTEKGVQSKINPEFLAYKHTAVHTLFK
uniref:Uncharacterized protein n=1 Tax=Rhizophora mucronata TaxID=61149 RepID=A0A2P2LQ38_RHIMU